MQRWIQSALVYAEYIVRQLANPLRDGPAVHRLKTQNLQNEEVRRALKKFGGLVTLSPQ